VVEKIRERLNKQTPWPVVRKRTIPTEERPAVNKQGSHNFHIDRFNLTNLNEVEGKEKYRVEFSNRFAALEDLDAEVEINTTWETISEN
jgi:hypothetical protein